MNKANIRLSYLVFMDMVPCTVYSVHYKFKCEIPVNEFVFIRIIYYFKHITFLKIFKYILIIGYLSFNWLFSKPRIKNMNPQLPK